MCRIKYAAPLAAAFIIGLLVFYSYTTVEQNDYWREPVAFYKRTIKYNPGNVKLHVNLGNVYWADGKSEEAISSYKKAIKINPDDVIAHINLGNAYGATGRTKEAIAAYKKVLGIDPGNKHACRQLQKYN